MCEQASVCSSYLRVIGLAWDRREHLAHVCRSSLPPPPIRELETHEQLGDRYRGHCHIVVVAHQIVECGAVPLSVDQNRRVKDQSLQRRSSI